MHGRVDVSRKIYDNIANRILTKELQSGELIPSTTSLSLKYGLAVNTVRSACERLEQNGFVRAEKGRGTRVVHEPDSQEGVERLLRHIGENRTFILELYRLLELFLPPMAAYGLSLCRKSELLELRKLGCEVFREDLSPYQKFDLSEKLYLRLVEPACNSRFNHILSNSLLFTRLPAVLLGKQDPTEEARYAKEVVSYLSRVLDCIHKRNGEKLQNLMRIAFQRAYKNVSEKFSILEGYPEEPPRGSAYWTDDQYFHPVHMAIAMDLNRKIRQGEYLAGDVLPSEEALQEQYRTSASAVRGALETLKKMGILEKHQGRGTKVIPTVRSMEEGRIAVHQDVHEVFCCLQMATVTSCSVAEAAAGLITREQARDLRRKNDWMKEDERSALYSHGGALVELINSVIQPETVRSVYLRIEKEFFFEKPPASVKNKWFQEQMEQEKRLVCRAVDSLCREDVKNFTQDYREFWEILTKIAMYLLQANGYVCDLPLPIR